LAVAEKAVRHIPSHTFPAAGAEQTVRRRMLRVVAYKSVILHAQGCAGRILKELGFRQPGGGLRMDQSSNPITCAKIEFSSSYSSF